MMDIELNKGVGAEATRYHVNIVVASRGPSLCLAPDGPVMF